MKISQFASKYGVTNDTIRYYMELNLIIPEKKGGHYDFDQKCEKQLLEVIDLKEMGFSLQDIKKIITYQKIAHLTNFQKGHYYRELFGKRLLETEEKIAELTSFKERLINKLAEFEAEEKQNSSLTGIKLSNLSLFACPECGQELLLQADKVTANQIINGSLNCNCGVSLKIEDGILYSNNVQENFQDIEDNFLEEYAKYTAPDYLDGVFQSLFWMHKHFSEYDHQGKTILELGSGYGFFLRNIYKDLADNSVYICVDHQASQNIFLKNILETIDTELNIIFITAELPDLPLKKKSIDILVDYGGSTNYSFDKPGFLIELIEKYLKDELLLFGTYITFEKFGFEAIIPEEFREFFKFENILKKFKQLNYNIIKENNLELAIDNDPGKFENYTRSGDKVVKHQLITKRWG